MAPYPEHISSRARIAFRHVSSSSAPAILPRVYADLLHLPCSHQHEVYLLSDAPAASQIALDLKEVQFSASASCREHEPSRHPAPPK